MTMLPSPITANSAQQRLQNDGLDALGVTMPLLGAAWSSAAANFDEATFTLTTTGAPQAPLMAIRSWVDNLAAYGVSGLDGAPLSGAGAIVRIHPQAATRLARLISHRLPGEVGLVRPLPASLVIRETPAGASSPTTARWYGPGEVMITGDGTERTLSFHDDRGLIIDPVAVAGLFLDLLDALPGLGPDTPDAGPGGLATIAAEGPAGTFVHVVDPHGSTFDDVGGVGIHLMTGSTDDGAVGASGLASLGVGQSLGIPDAAAARLRLGWARNDVLDRVALTPPALPGDVTLHRQFLRVTAVDLDWHLLGNRSDSIRHGIGPADQSMPDEFRPRVRDRVRLDYHVDGVATLGAANEVFTPLFQPGADSFVFFLASPTLEADVGLPPEPGPDGHWPLFPTPPPGVPGPAPTAAPLGAVTAQWSGERDVVVTVGAGTLPLGAHVRIYPQVFQLITSITADQPSFLRGDGAATLVADANAVTMSLTNPLGLPDGSNQPVGSLLTFDLVVVQRDGTLATHGNIVVPVTAGPPPAVDDPFGVPVTDVDVLDAFLPTAPEVLSVAPSPVFGIPSTVTPVVDPALPEILGMLRSLASETTPRSGPRLPTMARFPTLAVSTLRDDSVPDDVTVDWDALVSGGRWARETRSSDPGRANPGGPAGPDVHAPGVRVDGRAAFDVAQIAMRRVRPLVPLGAFSDGWIPFVGSAEWVEPAEPADDSAPAGQRARTGAAAVLRTVAIGVETPEMSLPGIPIPAPNATVQNIVNSIFAGLPISIDIDVAREEQIVREIRREFHWSRFGARDAQWALRRAIAEARDLVFVASPQFSATAYPVDPTDPDAHEVDLVSELADRMAAHPSLLVVVCMPRWPDFHEEYGGWVRHAFQARNAAIAQLTAVDPQRVVAFHPRGFPGRHAAIRTTTVVVDDVWALTGTSHWRRRGMTFDEGVDVVGFDRALDGGGASTRIRTHRRALMASLGGIAPTEPEFVRLFGTRTCVDVVQDLVGQGGLGRLAPFWTGPADIDVVAQSDTIADPDGGDTDDYLLLLPLIGESPT